MSSADTPLIAFVVPCFNEEAALPRTIREPNGRLQELVQAQAISPASYILFVDDGSADATWTAIAQACAAQPQRIRGLKLAHNAGHQNALLAGLMSQIGKAQAMISLDADLQDDISVVGTMVDQFRNNGADIVFGVRKDRTSDTVFKRASADFYYRPVDVLGAKVIPHHADFRLMSDRAVRALASYGEVNLFLRGLVA